MTKQDHFRIAYFISPHGLGHAARAAGVMDALSDLEPETGFEIFTLVPEWFFKDSLPGGFEYHPVLTDIGLVQRDPLHADLTATLKRLNRFLPLDPVEIQRLADLIRERRCQLIVCDIAPMGIAVAGAAGVPSVLVENFTWEWLYEEYVKYDGRIGRYIPYLKGLTKKADYHIQTEPVCEPQNSDLFTSPVSRKIRTPAGQIRKQLGIHDDKKMVMITMGGIPEQSADLGKLEGMEGIDFIIPGAAEEIKVQGNLWLLPRHSAFYHPDLVNACDAVIGKVGYSTLAEVYHAGLPFGYIARKRFRESQVLVSYIENQMKGIPIDENRFYRGDWISCLPKLLALPGIQRKGTPGAVQAARFIQKLLRRLD